MASPELVAAGKADAIKGWEHITVELSAGEDGLRHLMVTLDASGTPISAGDWVMYCSGDPTEYAHENMGGRLQPDGSFLGTRWRTTAVDVPGKDEPEQKEAVSSEPTPEDVAALMALVKELLQRAKQPYLRPSYQA